MTYSNIQDTHSLYIHWPFCPYRCHYCPFVALASQDHFMEPYHYALKKEIELFGDQFNVAPSIDTIFFGGGTPSTYPDDLLLDMFGILKNKYVITKQTEVTIEVNPGTVREGQIALWQQLGINRLSVGVQSLKDGVLQKLNRHQTLQDVYTLLRMAPAIIENISIDLILGLPEVEPVEWKAFIKEIVSWPIKHMSVYFLTVHEDTPLYFKVQKKQVTIPADDEVVDLYYWTRDILAAHGFEQYELSNFAKKGYQSRHNSVYWDRKPYKGFGLGACSFDGSNRFQNEKNLTKYINGVKNNSDITIFSEQLTVRQIYLEKLMLNLRRHHGLCINDLEAGVPSTQLRELREKIDLLTQQGFMEKKDEKLKLTPRGLVVENEIVTQLIM